MMDYRAGSSRRVEKAMAFGGDPPSIPPAMTRHLAALLADWEFSLVGRIAVYEGERRSAASEVQINARRTTASRLSLALLGAVSLGTWPPAPGPESGPLRDPLGAFGRDEARLHHCQGGTLTETLGLLKACRQSCSAHLRTSGWIAADLVAGLEFVERAFDCIEMGYISEWEALSGDARLIELVESMGDGIAIVGPGETFAYANRAADHLLGVQAGTLVGRSLIAFLASGEAERVAAQTRERETGKVGGYEIEIVRPDGSHRWLHVTASPQRSPSGAFIGSFGIFRDVTEKREAEKALESQANFLRTLMDAVPAPVFVKDSRGRYLDCNRAFEEFTGKRREVMRGKTVHDLFPEEFAATYHRMDLELLRAGGVQIYKAKVEARSGEIRSVMYHKATFGAGPTAEGLVGVMLDITESERLLERLTTANLVVEESPTILVRCGTGKGWPVEFITENVSQFGYDASTLMSGKVPYADLVYPEDLGRVQAEFLMFLEGGADRFESEYRLRCPNGSPCWVEERTCAIREPNGAILGFQGTVTNIAARHRAQEEIRRLAHAVEHSAESVVITDPQANIVYVNPAFESVTGYSREEVLGQNPRILRSGDHGAEFYQDLWGTLASGATWRGRFSNRRKSGEVFVEESTISPVLDDRGGTIYYIALKRDVTRELGLEEELLQSKKMEAVGRLAGGVAHDFNNIVTAILTCAEVSLAAPGTPEGVRENLDEILRAAQRAASVTNQLLAFGRKQILKPSSVDMADRISDAAILLRRLLPEDIRLALDLPRGTWPVKADPTQVDQVLLNLAINARDAMPRGGVLGLAIRNEIVEASEMSEPRAPAPGRYVHLTVSDTGMGMTPDQKSHLFEPFYTTKDVGKGTGLGLSTAYGIVKQSGGEIWAASLPREGTTFHIRLPASPDPVAPKPPEEPHRPSRVSGVRVLLAEDEESVRKAVALLLHHLGCEVAESPGVKEAERLFSEAPESFDLLLTDMVMPDGSGSDLFACLAQIRGDLKVIFMSGYTEDAMIRGGALGRHMGFLAKPFSMAALREKIGEILAE